MSEYFTDQHVANKRLLSAVIALAIKDACKGSSNKRLPSDTQSAFNFLFEHSDLYLSLLDIDPQQFRKRLVAHVHQRLSATTMPYHLTHIERRCFAMNYRRWLHQSVHEREPVYEEEDEEEYE
jgi:hypothetical protein